MVAAKSLRVDIGSAPFASCPPSLGNTEADIFFKIAEPLSIAHHGYGLSDAIAIVICEIPARRPDAEDANGVCHVA
jgi:hypothetical protein